MIPLGVLVGIGAAFTGLGGGFLMVPTLLFVGYSVHRAVGTSFLAIVIISLSALVAHNKLANVDYKVGILLGLGGIIGAQIGALARACSNATIQKDIFLRAGGSCIVPVLPEIGRWPNEKLDAL